METPNLAQVAEAVRTALRQINPAEGRVAIVLNQHTTRISVGRYIMSGHVRCGLTSAAFDSDPRTVARRLLADLS